jgi:pyruvate carboxylase
MELRFYLGLNSPIPVAMKVGVPVVPGTPGPVDTYSDGDAFIKEHGFPGAFFFPLGSSHKS